ncbi:MAG: hypothetical protein OHK0038_18440 [Flammeovirgaceae bacterium]
MSWKLSLFIYFLIINLVFSKEKVLIVPVISSQINICTLLSKDFDTNLIISKISEEFDENEFEFVNHQNIIQNSIFAFENYDNLFLIDKLIEYSKTNFVLFYQYEFIESASGNYVKLQINLKDNEGNEINSYYTKSNKMYTDDRASLIKLAFKKISKSLFEDIKNQSSHKLDEFLTSETKIDDFEEKYFSELEFNIPKSKNINENAVAVVIGNSMYSSADIPKVDFAIQDARVVKKYLRECFGFKQENIIYLENASQADFYSIFGNESNEKGKLFNYIKPKISDVFVFYSGHGAPNPESKEAFLVPKDSEPSLIQFNGYSLKTLYSNLGKLQYKSLTLVIDACFSGNSASGTLLKNISPIHIKTEERILKDNNALIINSCSAEQVSSWYPEKKHSLLTYFFLKSIRGDADADKNKRITVGEISTYLNENVTYWARRLNNREQTPKIWGKSEKVVISLE